ncbi:MAG: HesA/MoeB/ThiF family protein [Bacteroidota bacterium]
MSGKRYSRQVILPGVGEAGQARLAAAHVLVVGCGGLGSPAAVYLAGAGIGTLTLVDGDTVNLSNLHRQVFFRTEEAGPKARLLAQHCRQLNPGTRVRAHESFLDANNVKALVEAADLVLDCTDDATTKHLLNDACVLLHTPLVYAAAQTFEGYLALFPNAPSTSFGDHPGSVKLRDLFPNPDPALPDCATTGVLPTAVGTVALLQANAALCFLLGIGEPPVNTLLTFNALTNRQHRLKIRKTYQQPIVPPWAQTRPSRAALETTNDNFADYDQVFSMLTEDREPDLPTGVIRLTRRNPFGQCMEQMQPGGSYLLYCNSGKLSLVLAAQIRKANPEIEAVSLRGGRSRR